MASISLEYPDAQGKRIVDALCLDGGWSADMGVTRAAFAKAQAATIIRQRVLEIERTSARQAAVAAVPEPTPVDLT
jgi:hypothetical protein